MKTFQQFQEEIKTITEIKKRLIGTALLATPFLMKKFLKPKSDKFIDNERKTNKSIGGDYRSGNTSDFESGVNAIKQKKEDKKTGKTRVFGDPTGQYSDFFK
jgi:K+-transporting ATPase c subunit